MTPNLAADLMRRLKSDPAFFCRRVLGVEPWSKQIEVLRALRDTDRVAVRSGHGTGKSFISSAAALWFLYSHYPAKVITTAPTQNQVRNILWKEIRTLYNRARVALGGKALEERISLTDNSFAVGIATDEADRFQGYHAEHVLVILDEAPGVREDIWEVAETLLTGRVGKILAIGNPTRPAGLFHDAFNPGSSWTQIHISCLDSPNVKDTFTPSGSTPAKAAQLYPGLVTRRWVESRRKEWGTSSPLWKSRVLGEFPDDESSLLIPKAWLETSLPPAAPPATSAPLPGAAGRGWGPSLLRMGVDVARHGSDDTVFLIRDGSRIVHLERRNGATTMETAGRTIDLIKKFFVNHEDVFIDDTGIGAGVTDRLREQGYGVTPVIAAARAADPARYANLRAECFWRLREALMPGRDEPTFCVAKEHGELRRQLAGLTFSFTSAGAIKIADKATLRSRLSGSPDQADALALTFCPAAQTAAPEVTLI